MKRVAITSAIRNLVREQNTDSGGLLENELNLYEYENDATEQVVLDLMPYMPEQFLTSETITLVPNQANYTLTNEFWMIYKVENNVTDDSPKELEIIEPLEFAYWTKVGETEELPTKVYFLGSTIYFVKTPSTAKTNYAKIWLVRPEVVEMTEDGPSYIFRPAHRMIVYKACELVAISLGVSPVAFQNLYTQRMSAVLRLWSQRYISQPRFVKESINERILMSTRDRILYDPDWP